MKDKLIEFFEKRPAVNKHGFAKECGISGSYLQYLLNGRYQASQKVEIAIKDAMLKYGYIPN